jgi:hypothetical protein
MSARLAFKLPMLFEAVRLYEAVVRVCTEGDIHAAPLVAPVRENETQPARLEQTAPVETVDSCRP